MTVRSHPVVTAKEIVSGVGARIVPAGVNVIPDAVDKDLIPGVPGIVRLPENGVALNVQTHQDPLEDIRVSVTDDLPA